MRGIWGKKVKTMEEGTLIVTVDVGMTSNTGHCSTIDGKDIEPFKFGNTREGLEKFWSMFVASKNRFRCNDVMVGYESTGRYAEPLVHYLMEKPVTIVQVNPLHTKRIKEVNDNSPLVAGLIGEVGDFTRFRTQAEIMKLAGLDLYEISSGKRRGQRRISKRGRSLLRKILHNAAVGPYERMGSCAAIIIASSAGA